MRWRMVLIAYQAWCVCREREQSDEFGLMKTMHGSLSRLVKMCLQLKQLTNQLQKDTANEYFSYICTE